VAVFHPQFEFGGLEEEDAVLHYEKRAPIPLINLLRTEAIDRGIEKGVYIYTFLNICTYVYICIYIYMYIYIYIDG
jgi:hypothetical protein